MFIRPVVSGFNRTVIGSQEDEVKRHLLTGAVAVLQMRNLTCGLYVDPHKQLWLATGQDGQVFTIDWDGNVLGAIGNGPGRGEGQFAESNYMVMDSEGNLYTGDTSVPRITQMLAPRTTAQ